MPKIFREKRPARKELRNPIFVVQQHSASSMHYDVRLEVDGVLKSWAVPKGPSLNPKDKRLAIMVDDHPLSYASFEGIIPEGSYGAGSVIIWDSGTYLNLRENRTMEQSVADGHVVVWLKGKKLRGGFALIKTKTDWLLLKMADLEADTGDVLQLDRSVVSGRTVEEVAAEERRRKRVLEQIPKGVELER